MTDSLVSKSPAVDSTEGLNGNQSSSPQRSPLRSPKNGSQSSSGGSTAAFVHKLYSMLEEDNELIKWAPSGDVFYVSNPNEFSHTILPQYFKHNNWQSFVRQLNMYGFHKVNDVFHTTTNDFQSSCEFKHPDFQRGRHDLLGSIKRKCPKSSLSLNKLGGIPLTGQQAAEVHEERLDSVTKRLGEMEQKYVHLSRSHEAMAQQMALWRTLASEQQKLLSETIHLINSLCRQQDNKEFVKIAQSLAQSASTLQQDMTQRAPAASSSEYFTSNNTYPLLAQHFRPAHDQFAMNSAPVAIPPNHSGNGTSSPALSQPGSARSSGSNEMRPEAGINGARGSESFNAPGVGIGAARYNSHITLPPIQFPSAAPFASPGAPPPGDPVLVRCQSPETVGDMPAKDGEKRAGSAPYPASPAQQKQGRLPRINSLHQPSDGYKPIAIQPKSQPPPPQQPQPQQQPHQKYSRDQNGTDRWEDGKVESHDSKRRRRESD
ncbi:uncharacterized protein VTP21DRAFT_7920 [Calcarisporiella thermophila]|uniref:uncharacterized protein n=1 Tax=Calcarisporiella thermophila TaxID=911321 RepID=UPI00374437F7